MHDKTKEVDYDLARRAISSKCHEISKLFYPGALVSVIVRNPGFDDAEPHSVAMFVTTDDIASAIEAAQYLQKNQVEDAD